MFASLENSIKWFKTAKSVIKTPRTFFREMPASGSLKEPSGFAIRTILLISLLYAPVLFFYWSQNFSIGKDAYYFILGMAALFLYSVISTSISIPVNAVISHVLLLVLGAKGNFKATISVVCYSLSVSFAIFPVITIIALIFQIVVESGVKGMLYQGISLLILLGIFIPVGYAYYVLFVGFSEVHNISIKRVLLALIGIPAGLFILMVAFAMIFVFFTGFSSSMDISPPSPENHISNDMNEHPQKSNPMQPKLTAPYGSAPILDGYYTPKDKWDETQATAFISGNISYSIAAKHDGENLYTLVKWESGPEWDGIMGLIYEQDGDSHDHNLMTGRNITMIYLDEDDVDNSFITPYGDAKVNYNDGVRVMESYIPLTNPDPDNMKYLFINQTPSTLGFMIFMPWKNNPGSWPVSSAGPYKPETWGDVVILP